MDDYENGIVDALVCGSMTRIVFKERVGPVLTLAQYQPEEEKIMVSLTNLDWFNNTDKMLSWIANHEELHRFLFLNVHELGLSRVKEEMFMHPIAGVKEHHQIIDRFDDKFNKLWSRINSDPITKLFFKIHDLILDKCGKD